jgi:hypothetical protein
MYAHRHMSNHIRDANFKTCGETEKKLLKDK